jgi:hypothetical protein
MPSTTYVLPQSRRALGERAYGPVVDLQPVGGIIVVVREALLIAGLLLISLLVG